MARPNKIENSLLIEHKVELVSEEYKALRDEIVKRIEIDHRILSLSLIALGAVLTAGLETQRAIPILIYPVLELALVFVWVSNSVRINNIRQYIKNEIEDYVGEYAINWEHYNTRLSRAFNVIHFLGSRGIFLGTEIVALIAALFLVKAKFASWSGESILLALAILSIVITLVLVFLPINRL